MTRSERTQLGWIGYVAIRKKRSGSAAGFAWALIGFLLFALACFAAGAVLELIQRAGA